MINYEELYLMPALLKAHGSVMGVAFVIVLPLGAWCLRLVQSKNGVWLHVALQILGWVMMLAGLGLGIKAGSIVDIVGLVHSHRYYAIYLRFAARKEYAYHSWHDRCGFAHSPTIYWFDTSSSVQENSTTWNLVAHSSMVRSGSYTTWDDQWRTWVAIGQQHPRRKDCVWCDYRDLWMCFHSVDSLERDAE